MIGATAMAATGIAFPAPAALRGKGDIRTINLVNPKTGDRLNAVYWVEGRYINEVLAEIDHLMRDWRQDAVKKMAPGVIDIMSATQRMLETSEPLKIYSGYRTPKTNRMLRRRSRGVASNSYHMKAMAADIHLDGRSVRQIARAAAALGAGGVGRYSRSNFVHVDCGPLRSWGR